MKNLPKKIYLQIGGSDVTIDKSTTDWNDLFHGEITWAEHRINDNDIEFVLSDVVDSKPPVSGWVAVSEKKPEAAQWLLVYGPSGRHIAWYNGFQFEDREDYNIEGVTHWMQIPEPPCV